MAQKLNDGHFSELCDRIHVVRELMATIIDKHPALVTKQKWMDDFLQADAALGRVYQAAGTKAADLEFRSEDKFKAAVDKEVLKRLNIRKAVLTVMKQRKQNKK